MSVGRDARVDSQQRLGLNVFLHGDLDESAAFHHVVDDKISDSQFQSFFDLFIALVVAVEINLAHVHAGPAHAVKLAATDHVESQSLGRQQLEQGDGRKRLRCICDLRVEEIG